MAKTIGLGMFLEMVRDWGGLPYSKNVAKTDCFNNMFGVRVPTLISHNFQKHTQTNGFSYILEA